MSRQFEESGDPDDAEEFQHLVLFFHPRHEEVQVEGHCGHKVDDVHRCSEENQFNRTDQESGDEFEAKPSIADAFHVEEGIVWFAPSLFQDPRLTEVLSSPMSVRFRVVGCCER